MAVPPRQKNSGTTGDRVLPAPLRPKTNGQCTDDELLGKVKQVVSVVETAPVAPIFKKRGRLQLPPAPPPQLPSKAGKPAGKNASQAGSSAASTTADNAEPASKNDIKTAGTTAGKTEPGDINAPKHTTESARKGESASAKPAKGGVEMEAVATVPKKPKKNATPSLRGFRVCTSAEAVVGEEALEAVSSRRAVGSAGGEVEGSTGRQEEAAVAGEEAKTGAVADGGAAKRSDNIASEFAIDGSVTMMEVSTATAVVDVCFASGRSERGRGGAGREGVGDGDAKAEGEEDGVEEGRLEEGGASGSTAASVGGREAALEDVDLVGGAEKEKGRGEATGCSNTFVTPAAATAATDADFIAAAATATDPTAAAPTATAPTAPTASGGRVSKRVAAAAAASAKAAAAAAVAAAADAAAATKLAVEKKAEKKRAARARRKTFAAAATAAAAAAAAAATTAADSGKTNPAKVTPVDDAPGGGTTGDSMMDGSDCDAGEGSTPSEEASGAGRVEECGGGAAKQEASKTGRLKAASAMSMAKPGRLASIFLPRASAKAAAATKAVSMVAAEVATGVAVEATAGATAAAVTSPKATAKPTAKAIARSTAKATTSPTAKATDKTTATATVEATAVGAAEATTEAPTRKSSTTSKAATVKATTQATRKKLSTTAKAAAKPTATTAPKSAATDGPKSNAQADATVTLDGIVDDVGEAQVVIGASRATHPSVPSAPTPRLAPMFLPKASRPAGPNTGAKRKGGHEPPEEVRKGKSTGKQKGKENDDEKGEDEEKGKEKGNEKEREEVVREEENKGGRRRGRPRGSKRVVLETKDDPQDVRKVEDAEMEVAEGGQEALGRGKRRGRGAGKAGMIGISSPVLDATAASGGGGGGSKTVEVSAILSSLPVSWP